MLYLNKLIDFLARDWLRSIFLLLPADGFMHAFPYLHVTATSLSSTTLSLRCDTGLDRAPGPSCFSLMGKVAKSWFYFLSHHGSFLVRISDYHSARPWPCFDQNSFPYSYYFDERYPQYGKARFCSTVVLSMFAIGIGSGLMVLAAIAFAFARGCSLSCNGLNILLSSLAVSIL
jgi:hypothetical protein